jgi:hypothetical protein
MNAVKPGAYLSAEVEEVLRSLFARRGARAGGVGFACDAATLAPGDLIPAR